MSARTLFRGMSPPSFGQGLVIAAAICAAWIIWSESRDRGWIPGLPGRTADAVDQNRQRDPFKPREPVSVPPLIADLANIIDPDARRQALLKLSSIGPDAAEALDAIRERLKDEDEGVRYAAVLALSRVSQDPDVVIPELRAMLDDDNSGVRDVAGDTLAAIGRPSTGLALDLLHSDSPAARSRALFILQRIVCPETFSAVSEAVGALCQDPDPEVRTEALVAFVDWGMIDKSGIRYLLRTDQRVPGVRPRTDPTRNSRELALNAITWLGPEAADLVPDLVEMLEEYPELEIAANRNQDGRQVPYRTLAPGVTSILRTLGSLKTVARPASPYLLGRLKDLDRHSRETLVGILLDIGADPEVLTQLVSSPLAESHHYAADRVGNLLARTDPAEARRQVSLLIPKLADPNKPIDQVALYALTGLAREAREAVPLLISLLSDRGPEAAYCATQALANLGPDAATAVPSLIGILDHTRANGKCNQHFVTFDALGRIGPAAKSAVPLLLAILNDPTPALPPTNLKPQTEQSTFHEYAMRALGKIGSGSPEVLSAIRRHLSNESSLRRSAAIYALAQLANDSPQVLAEIVETLQNDSDGNVRASSAIAITTMSGNCLPAIAPLTASLQDPDLKVRRAAAMALASTGLAAKSSLPALRQALLEARCGIPGLTSRGPGQFYDPNQLPLAQALLKAIAEIERAE